RDYGLAPMLWPDPWPTNYLTAMRAATFAFTIGRGREFTMQAFRNAFQRGQELSVADRVLDTGEQIGLDRRELETATGEPQIKQALRTATDAAHATGVTGVPTVAVDRELFWGDDRLEEAAAHVARVTRGHGCCSSFTSSRSGTSASPTFSRSASRCATSARVRSSAVPSRSPAESAPRASGRG